MPEQELSASARWRKSLQQHVTAVGQNVFRERVATWIAAYHGGASQATSKRNGDVLRGLILARALSPDDAFAQTLGDVAITAAKKVPNVGPRSIKVFNACLTALGGMDTPAALAQLTRLRARLKTPRLNRAVTTALDAAAGRQGVGLAELEELVVPTFGMTEVGVLRVAIGEWTAQVKIVGTHEVEVRWIAPSGKVQASAPAALKEGHRGAVAEVARTAKEMAAMLVAQRDRLELLPLGGRAWPAGTWRERYLDHPLLGPLARRLIWRVRDEGGERAVAWDGASLVDVSDRAITLGNAASVEPWHPLTADVDTVRAWRQWLERHQVVQPFKQAHREIYVLTDAERRTRTYSNRFAAHIIKQHQFAALCRARGWRYQLQGWFDNANTPTRDLPEHGLKAEFWVEPCVTDDTAASGAGIALYATTDQVRFVGADAQPMALERVPPLLFSELLRDVDLFVGVASVGRTPRGWTRASGRRTTSTGGRMPSGSSPPRRSLGAKCSPNCCPGSPSPPDAHWRTDSWSCAGSSSHYKTTSGAQHPHESQRPVSLHRAGPRRAGCPGAGQDLAAVRRGRHARRDPEQGLPPRERRGNHRREHHAANCAQGNPPLISHILDQRGELRERRSPARLVVGSRQAVR